MYTWHFCLWEMPIYADEIFCFPRLRRGKQVKCAICLFRAYENGLTKDVTHTIIIECLRLDGCSKLKSVVISRLMWAFSSVG